MRLSLAIKKSGTKDYYSRILTVDVNNVLAQLSLVEADAEMDVSDIVEEHNPDCYVLVYAVDDIESFGEFLQATLVTDFHS